MATVSALTVFCGSSNAAAANYRTAVERLGRTLARQRVRLIYGGGNVGLMGVAANAALDADGEVTGVIPRHIMAAEVGHTSLTELIVVDTMHQRKHKMFELSDGFVVLPGGIGTLDETIEILSWRSLDLHEKPTVLVNIDGFWDPLIDLLEHTVQNNFSKTEIHDYYTVVHGVDEVLGAVEARMRPSKPARQDII